MIALAGPLLLTEGREVSGNRAIVRAIIVDTSASMSRPVASSVAGPASRSGGVAAETGRDVAQREAARLASDAATSVIVQTSEPSQAVRGAVAWLGTRQGRREVVEWSKALGEVVGGELDLHAVAGQDADEVLAHLAGDVRQHLVLVLQLDAEHRVRQRLDHRCLDLDRLFFLRQTLSSPNVKDLQADCDVAIKKLDNDVVEIAL